MMDDTQDKVRRNLVVYSAAIVLGWFLNLKLTDLPEPLMRMNIASINDGRLWMVALVVLVYLFLRYRFDSQTNAQIVHLSEELESRRESYVYKYLGQKIDWINRTGKFHPVFDASLSESVTQNIERYEKEESDKFSFRLHIGGPIEIRPTHVVLRGFIGITEEYRREGSDRNCLISAGQRHQFSISSINRVWIYLHTLIHIMAYSKSAVDLLVPMGLFFCAALISVCKLIAIYSS